MRRFAVLICVLCVLLSGCAFWMPGERLTITPHEAKNSQKSSEVMEVISFAQLRSTLKELVEQGVEEAVLSASSFNETTLDYYVSTAVNNITDNTAIGAYAVNKITYEIGTNRGVPVVAFRIEYKHAKTEIDALKTVKTTEEMVEQLTGALDNCEQSVALFVEHYEPFDFAKYIDEYANSHPDRVMETPYVSVAAYPTTGEERVLEITLTYFTDKEELLEMQRYVQAVFTSAELYVNKTDEVIDVYSRLYSFLMERSEYSLQTSQTPAYDLLHSGIGDSRAFANVYAAMCSRVGLECDVVSGLRDGEQWYWNAFQYRGQTYHIDLLRCNENNMFVLTHGKELTGYEWDIAAFPLE